MFQEIQTAYETLSDSRKRRDYDLYGGNGTTRMTTTTRTQTFRTNFAYSDMGSNHFFHQRGPWAQNLDLDDILELLRQAEVMSEFDRRRQFHTTTTTRREEAPFISKVMPLLVLIFVFLFISLAGSNNIVK